MSEAESYRKQLEQIFQQGHEVEQRMIEQRTPEVIQALAERAALLGVSLEDMQALVEQGYGYMAMEAYIYDLENPIEEEGVEAEPGPAPLKCPQCGSTNLTEIKGEAFEGMECQGCSTVYEVQKRADGTIRLTSF